MTNKNILKFLSLRIHFRIYNNVGVWELQILGELDSLQKERKLNFTK